MTGRTRWVRIVPPKIPITEELRPYGPCPHCGRYQLARRRVTHYRIFRKDKVWLYAICHHCQYREDHGEKPQEG